jgi:peptide deformylase
MAILDIKTYPDACLRRKCREVEVVDSEIRRLLDDMAMTMYAVKGIGLAAPQVGLDIMLAVIDTGKGLIKLVNPKIIKSEGFSILEEGCLSIPDIYVKVKRKSKLVVSAMDNYGKAQLIKAEGLLAHAFGQEIDHLNGRLIIDYLPFYKKLFLKHNKG